MPMNPQGASSLLRESGAAPERAGQQEQGWQSWADCWGNELWWRAGLTRGLGGSAMQLSREGTGKGEDPRMGDWQVLQHRRAAQSVLGILNGIGGLANLAWKPKLAFLHSNIL